MKNIPSVQTALQLVGPDKLVLNTGKEVPLPGPYQILVRVEAVGLCFSDLKLLKQFDSHPRKSGVVSGIEPQALSELPSYKPAKLPTVPGHEACCVIVAVGDKVERHRPGRRVLVQADYRWLKTAGSNAAFGYNFEGALQQYVLMDERMIIEPESGHSCLIDVDESLGASAAALVEPWACVESAYASKERRTIRAGGNLLVVVDDNCEAAGLAGGFSPDGPPADITVCCMDRQYRILKKQFPDCRQAADINSLRNESFDDIVCFGADKDRLEILNDKLAHGGIINVVLSGRTIGRPVSVGVGRVHYGLTRWIGTVGKDAAESYKIIPATGELRDGDRVLIIGAAGPMGQMHTIRAVCSGLKNLSVTATDFDDQRLESLGQKAAMPDDGNAAPLRLVNPQKQPLTEKFSYIALMAPVGGLVAASVRDSLDGALINIFAGIPAAVKQELDLDTYISRRCFMFGSSGSRLSDMESVLKKVTAGRLDTNRSVDAVCGMAGAVDGIRAVENRTMPGKIVVYPSLEKLPLIALTQLAQTCPEAADRLENGFWTKQAELALLNAAK